MIFTNANKKYKMIPNIYNEIPVIQYAYLRGVG